MNLWKRALRLSAAVCLVSCHGAGAAQSGPLSFADDIRPIFNKHCVGCHGGVKRAGDISFIVPETVVAQNASQTNRVILPGRPEKSELLRRVSSNDPAVRMPPPEHGPALAPDQIERLRTWIAQGAKWEPHWAFLPPSAKQTPKVKQADWARTGLDHFILARLEAAGLKPSAAAHKRAWLRRVTFDIVGLPPTTEEITDFLADHSASAHSNVVQRLLTSPAFGERWASVWLDLARYADSMGFEKDPNRSIWPWRDWVIRALNSNMPFDAFTVRQIAGDLLPDSTLEDRLATAFHRNTPTNTEGGTDDEEYRVAAVLDRVNTTFEAWQGITFKCTQCHDHPYEPIEHREYFSAAAFFNSTRDWDMREEYPVLKVPLDSATFSKARTLDESVTRLRQIDFAEFSRVRQDAGWATVTPVKAESDKGTRLVIKEAEVFTEGTVAHYSKFTVEFEAPAGLTNLSALRLRVLPINPEKALLNPEAGFAISQIETCMLNGTNVSPVRFAHAFADEAEPMSNPESILSTNKAGWGAIPKISHPREVVLVPQEPVQLAAESRIQVVIRHDLGPGDFPALVMNRFGVSASGSPEWQQLITGPGFAARRNEVAELQKQRDALRSTAVPVLQNLEEQLARPTAMFVRGDWLNKGEIVNPGVPHVFGHSTNVTDRLAFARWIASTNNPLTARVIVNRVWEQLFGLGLVETLEDFGSSGIPPSHPELLDYLAHRFQTEMHWNLKRLIAEIATSATYLQDSRTTPETLAVDPRNRLLSRGPRSRLSAEMVRDQALTASGLLATNMYGPPVMPPQPDGIWRAAYSSEKWITATNENRFRRAIYTYIRRTAGYPSFQTFDAPSREVCTPRRLRTNTPLQALVTMNDPVYIECAAALAKAMRAHSTELSASLRHGWERATSLEPSEEDLADITDLHAAALAGLQADPERSRKLAETPELAALTVVASTLLNLDAALTR